MTDGGMSINTNKINSACALRRGEQARGARDRLPRATPETIRHLARLTCPSLVFMQVLHGHTVAVLGEREPGEAR